MKTNDSEDIDTYVTMMEGRRPHYSCVAIARERDDSSYIGLDAPVSKNNLIHMANLSFELLSEVGFSVNLSFLLGVHHVLPSGMFPNQ